MIKILKVQIFTFMLLLFWGCVKKTADLDSLILSFEEFPTKRFPIDKESSSFLTLLDVDFNEEKKIFSYFDMMPNRIEVFHEESMAPLKTIQLETSGPSAIGPLQYHLFGDHLIFGTEKQNIIKLNREGTIVNKLIGKSLKFNEDPFLYNLDPSGSFGVVQNLDYGRKKMYLPIYRSDIGPYSEEFFLENKNIILELDLNSFDYKAIPIKFPDEILRYVPLLEVNWSILSPCITYHNNKLIYNFSFNNKIYVYDLDKKKSKIFEGKSKFTNQEIAHSFPSGISESELFDIEASGPEFGPVLYDQYRNLYLRVHSQFHKNLQMKHKYLMVFDPEFRKIGEIRLPKYLGFIFYSAPDGIYFYYKHPNDENFIYFNRLVIT